jgi:Fe-S cluster assembly protein SufD
VAQQRSRGRAGVTTAFTEAFERFSRNGGGRGPAELLTRRREAFGRFAADGFPTLKNEEWRFTPIAPIARTAWATAAAPSVRPNEEQVAPFRIGPPEWNTLVFLNGRYDAPLSRRSTLPPGVTIELLSPALERDPGLLDVRDATPFSALNAAFAADGVVIRVAAGVDLADPVHLLFLTTSDAEGQVIQVRCVFVVDAGARAQFVESYAGLGAAASFTNVVTDVGVGPNAWVEHSRIQRESESSYHIGLTRVEQGRDSHYRSFSLAMGGAIARHDLRTRLGDENVETLLYGLYLGRGEQLVDNHTVIYHDHPNCRSWEVYKGILDGKSHAVFNGKVLVTPEAQKTDAKQTNRNLLLSEGAKVDTKPQLEIFADDVRCTHGATVGRLDESAFFYLQSRGISRDQAQRLLTYAFAAEVTAEVASAPVRDALDALVMGRLSVTP